MKWEKIGLKRTVIPQRQSTSWSSMPVKCSDTAEGQPVVKYPGEKNRLEYIPLGVGVVIPPWNFPLAILVGMTTASIVAGNTVVLKPSSDSPAIAQMFFELMEEVGLPPGVLNFVPGDGSTIGDLT
jgi:1-pyrroline-5-carboxylate dehydrogenase